MKSAYELAMERLREEDPEATLALTPEQKEELADIDRIYKARIAEREVFLQGKLNEARAKQAPSEVDEIERQLRDERVRLEEEREEKKNAVRKRAAQG